MPIEAEAPAANCAEEWPCPEAQEKLRADFADEHNGLCGSYLGSQFWYAVKDIYYRQYPGPKPHEMFTRFMGWTRGG